MIRVFVLPSSLSCRKAIAHLEAVGQTYEVRKMHSEPLTFEEFKEILSYAHNGTDDVIAKTGKVYQEMMAAGIDVDDLSLSKLYLHVKYNPRLMRAPITIGGGYMEVGYSEEDYTKFNPRGLKLKDYMKKLDTLRTEDMRKIAAGEEIPSGYWGLDDWAMTFSGSV